MASLLFGLEGEEALIAKTMTMILGTMAACLFASTLTLTRKKSAKGGGGKRTSSRRGVASYGSKREGEAWCLKLAAVWIGAVVVVIVTQAYEGWKAKEYMAFGIFCFSLYVTVPFIFPGPEDKKRPWFERYITKANVWISIFSFIGNYWYTHYFYRVLKARYTFDAHRLNDVPICLYLMTHAYFMFYHALSNRVIRLIRDTYLSNKWRLFYTCTVIASMSYATAFGEAITICAFPYYSFENRYQAYTLGSAFYGIYFLVSYPMFFDVDEEAKVGKKGTQWSLQKTVVSALAAGMAVLCLLDFVRLYLGVELFVSY